MPRAQNAHALVNAGFLFQFDDSNKIKSARIIYGCINPTFIHAVNTENYLKGKNIFDNNILQEAMKTLDNELKPDHVLPDPTPEFRKKLAISLFFKVIFLGHNNFYLVFFSVYFKHRWRWTNKSKEQKWTSEADKADIKGNSRLRDKSISVPIDEANTENRSIRSSIRYF